MICSAFASAPSRSRWKTGAGGSNAGTVCREVKVWLYVPWLETRSDPPGWTVKVLREKTHDSTLLRGHAMVTVGMAEGLGRAAKSGPRARRENGRTDVWQAHHRISLTGVPCFCDDLA